MFTLSKRGASVGLAIVVAIGMGAAGVIPATTGRVQGGIVPCRAIPDPHGPRYAAGVVTVLKGDMTWRSTGSAGGPSVVGVPPTAVVASRSVGRDAVYEFTPAPGRYVLTAAYRDSTARPYIAITVNPGDDLLVDIPNVCI